MPLDPVGLAAQAPYGRRTLDPVDLAAQGFPDRGVDAADLAARAPAYAPPEPAPIRPVPANELTAIYGNEFTKGLRRGTLGIVGTTEGYAAQLAEPFSTKLSDQLFAEANKTLNFEEGLRPKVPTWKDVHGPSSFINYGLGKAGEALPSTAASLAAAGIGGAAGFGLRAAGLEAAGRLPLSFAAGSLSMLPQEGGESALSLHNDPGAMARTTPWQRLGISSLKGGVNSALEFTPEALALERAFKAPPIRHGFLHALAETGLGAAEATTGEALTEGLQEKTGQIAQNYANPQRDTSQDRASIREAMLGGAFGGVGLGAMGGGIHALRSNILPHTGEEAPPATTPAPPSGEGGAGLFNFISNLGQSVNQKLRQSNEWSDAKGKDLEILKSNPEFAGVLDKLPEGEQKAVVATLHAVRVAPNILDSAGGKSANELLNSYFGDNSLNRLTAAIQQPGTGDYSNVGGTRLAPFDDASTSFKGYSEEGEQRETERASDEGQKGFMDEVLPADKLGINKDILSAALQNRAHYRYNEATPEALRTNIPLKFTSSDGSMSPQDFIRSLTTQDFKPGERPRVREHTDDEVAYHSKDGSAELPISPMSLVSALSTVYKNQLGDMRQGQTGYSGQRKGDLFMSALSTLMNDGISITGADGKQHHFNVAIGDQAKTGKNGDLPDNLLINHDTQAGSYTVGNYKREGGQLFGTANPKALELERRAIEHFAPLADNQQAWDSEYKRLMARAPFGSLANKVLWKVGQNQDNLHNLLGKNIRNSVANGLRTINDDLDDTVKGLSDQTEGNPAQLLEELHDYLGSDGANEPSSAVKQLFKDNNVPLFTHETLSSEALKNDKGLRPQDSLLKNVEYLHQQALENYNFGLLSETEGNEGKNAETANVPGIGNTVWGTAGKPKIINRWTGTLGQRVTEQKKASLIQGHRNYQNIINNQGAWRVEAEGGQRAGYFKTKEEAQQFINDVPKDGFQILYKNYPYSIEKAKKKWPGWKEKFGEKKSPLSTDQVSIFNPETGEILSLAGQDFKNLPPEHAIQYLQSINKTLAQGTKLSPVDTTPMHTTAEAVPADVAQLIHDKELRGENVDNIRKAYAGTSRPLTAADLEKSIQTVPTQVQAKPAPSERTARGAIVQGKNVQAKLDLQSEQDLEDVRTQLSTERERKVNKNPALIKELEAEEARLIKYTPEGIAPARTQKEFAERGITDDFGNRVLPQKAEQKVELTPLEKKHQELAVEKAKRLRQEEHYTRSHQEEEAAIEKVRKEKGEEAAQKERARLEALRTNKQDKNLVTGRKRAEELEAAGELEKPDVLAPHAKQHKVLTEKAKAKAEAAEKSGVAHEVSHPEKAAAPTGLTPTRPEWHEPMSFPMPAGDNVTGKATTTFQLVKDGVRTATTRHSWKHMPQVGDIISFDNAEKTDSVRVQVTHVSKPLGELMIQGRKEGKTREQVLTELSKAEGWTAKRFIAEYEKGQTVGPRAKQVTYKLLDEPGKATEARTHAVDMGAFHRTEHYQRQAGLAQEQVNARAGKDAQLVREPNNKFDPNAVKVMVDGVQHGYLPKELAARVAPYMDKGKEMRAYFDKDNKLKLEYTPTKPTTTGMLGKNATIQSNLEQHLGPASEQRMQEAEQALQKLVDSVQNKEVGNIREGDKLKDFVNHIRNQLKDPDVSYREILKDVFDLSGRLEHFIYNELSGARTHKADKEQLNAAMDQAGEAVNTLLRALTPITDADETQAIKIIRDALGEHVQAFIAPFVRNLGLAGAHGVGIGKDTTRETIGLSTILLGLQDNPQEAIRETANHEVLHAALTRIEREYGIEAAKKIVDAAQAPHIVKQVLDQTKDEMVQEYLKANPEEMLAQAYGLWATGKLKLEADSKLAQFFKQLRDAVLEIIGKLKGDPLLAETFGAIQRGELSTRGKLSEEDIAQSMEKRKEAGLITYDANVAGSKAGEKQSTQSTQTPGVAPTSATHAATAQLIQSLVEKMFGKKVNVVFGIPNMTKNRSARGWYEGRSKLNELKANEAKLAEVRDQRRVALAQGDMTKVAALDQREQRLLRQEEVLGTIYLNPNNSVREMLPTFYHESVHAAFDILLSPAERAILGTAFSHGTVRRQLEKIFAGDAAVLAQMKDAEEAAAYGFQIHAAAPHMLQISNTLAAIFNKVAKWFREMTGALSAEDKAEIIMNDMLAGRLAEKGLSSVQTVLAADQTTQQKVAKHFNVIRDMVQKIWDVVASPSYKRMIETNNPALIAFAKAGSTKTGEHGDLGMIQRMQTEISARFNWVDKIQNKYTKDQLQAVAEHRMKNTYPTDPTLQRAYKDVDTFFNEFKKYADEAKMNIGFIKNYWPMMWDAAKVTKNKADFIAMVSQPKYAAEMAKLKATPDELYENIAGYVTRGDSFQNIMSPTGEPANAYSKERSLSFLEYDDRKAFMHDDPVQTMVNYTANMIRQAEYVRKYGEGGKQRDAMLDEAKNKYGATPEQISLANDYLDGLLGNKEVGMSRELKDIYGAMAVYQNYRLLSFNLFSSLVDPVGIAIRSGRIADALEAFIYATKNIFRDLQKNRPDASKDMYEKLALDWGYIEDAGTMSSLRHMMETTELRGFSKKMNDALFKWNLLNGWTRSTKIMAVKSGQRFMARIAEGKSSHDARHLKELGLTAADIMPTTEGNIALRKDEFMAQGMSEANAEKQEAKMREAMTKFVNQAILNPTAADLPNWGSNPYLAPVFHLKQFMFAFQTTIIDRIIQEAKEGNLKPLWIASIYIPGTIGAEALRGFVSNFGKQPPWQKNWGPVDYVKNGYARSGLMGTGQLFASIQDDIMHGGKGYESAVGPMAEQLYKGLRAVTKGDSSFFDFVVKSMPLNQIYDQWLLTSHKGPMGKHYGPNASSATSRS